MNHDIYVKVKGITEDSGEVEVSCEGKYAVVNDVEYIKYDEMLEEVNSRISNVIKISKDAVEMIKKGALASRMRFIPGAVTQCIYQTPFGEILMDVHTKSVRILRTDEQLRVMMEYQLGMGPAQQIDCKIDISVSNAG